MVYTRGIQKVSSVRSVAVMIVRMRADFLYPLASHRHHLRQSDRGDGSFSVFNMFKTNERPAACEMRSVTRFLNARNVVMSDLMVRRWIRNFKEGRENVHDEQQSGRPSVVNYDLVRAVEENVR
jgi:hypothetical protein